MWANLVITPAQLGLTPEPAHLARARRQAAGLTDLPGLLVIGVEPDSPAASAGIERGDLLTHLDGSAAISSTGLALQLRAPSRRRFVKAEILHGDETLTLLIGWPAAIGNS